MGGLHLNNLGINEALGNAENPRIGPTLDLADQALVIGRQGAPVAQPD